MSAAIVRVIGFCCAFWVAADKADLRAVEGNGDVVEWRDYTISKGHQRFFASEDENRPRCAAFAAVLYVQGCDDGGVAPSHIRFDASRRFMYNPLFPESWTRSTAGSVGIFLTINEVSNHVRGHKNRWQAI
jgi:hypothetical protein